MDLVRRYIDALKPHLPADQRDDIAAELEEAIRSRMDERAAELGRKLNTVEQEAILKEFGHPMQVAAGYGPQRSLIGPAVLPLWWDALRVALAAVVVTHLVAAGLAVSESRDVAEAAARMAPLWGHIWTWALVALGGVTLGAIVIERYQIGPKGAWSPRNLTPGRRTPGKIELAFGLFFSGLGLLFWLALPWYVSTHPATLEAIGKLRLAGVGLGEVWWPTLYWFGTASSVAQIGIYAVDLFRPDSPRLRALSKIAMNAITLATSAAAVLSGPLVYATQAASMEVAKAVLAVDMAFRAGFAISGLVALGFVIWNLVKLSRAGRKPGVLAMS